MKNKKNRQLIVGVFSIHTQIFFKISILTRYRLVLWRGMSQKPSAPKFLPTQVNLYQLRLNIVLFNPPKGLHPTRYNFFINHSFHTAHTSTRPKCIPLPMMGVISIRKRCWKILNCNDLINKPDTFLIIPIDLGNIINPTFWKLSTIKLIITSFRFSLNPRYVFGSYFGRDQYRS